MWHTLYPHVRLTTLLLHIQTCPHHPPSSSNRKNKFLNTPINNGSKPWNPTQPRLPNGTGFYCINLWWVSLSPLRANTHCSYHLLDSSHTIAGDLQPGIGPGCYCNASACHWLFLIWRAWGDGSVCVLLAAQLCGRKSPNWCRQAWSAGCKVGEEGIKGRAAQSGQHLLNGLQDDA